MINILKNHPFPQLRKAFLAPKEKKKRDPRLAGFCFAEQIHAITRSKSMHRDRDLV